MRNICMVVSYDGTAYNGFQSQPGGNTIQDHIEKAVRCLTGEDVKITASGRTDTGVHARGQVFNFLTASRIPIERWALAINSRLPSDIVILGAKEVHLAFHSRRSAKRKTYRYSIHIGKFPNVFRRHLEFHHYAPLNIEAMKEGLSYLVGEHDFSAYCTVASLKESNVRTIYQAWIEEEASDPGWAHASPFRLIHIYITGSGFLHHMVRIIVGTLLEIGEGKKEPQQVKRILDSKNRSLAGPTAMAHGLTLWEVYYEMDFHEIS